MGLLSPQLEAFIAVAKHKTVIAAADEIYLTQTAMTQRIRTLERMLRTTLFTRSRRGMSITPEGSALLRYCQAAKDLEGEALANIRGAGVETEIELSITATSSIMRSRVTPSCVQLIKKFPNLIMNFNVNDVENRHQTLRVGQCHFAIIQEEHLAQEMKFKKLQPEQYVLVCSAKWKDRKRDEIIKNERIIDFDATDQTTCNYLKLYNLFDIAQSSRHFVNRTRNLALLVCAGVGYTALTKEFVKPYLENKELILLNEGKIHDTHPILAWYERPEPPQYFSEVIDAIN